MVGLNIHGSSFKDKHFVRTSEHLFNKTKYYFISFTVINYL